MSKAKNNLPTVFTAAALVLAVWFVYSVIINARDLIEVNIKNAPASYALIVSLVFVVVAWHKAGKKLNTLSIVVLTILATAVTIWLFGLSTHYQLPV